MLTSTAAFIQYFERVRARTMAFVDAIPLEKMDWSPRAGEYSCGDLVRHLASVETMDVEAALGNGWRYPGHAPSLGESHAAARAYLHDTHARMMERLRTLPDAGLTTRRGDLEERPVAVWRILMAMVEHEIHHRSQLAAYLAELGVQPPQLFGVTVEELPRD
jgi:uncharacterized damage-inducible protein DinB